MQATSWAPALSQPAAAWFPPGEAFPDSDSGAVKCLLGQFAEYPSVRRGDISPAKWLSEGTSNRNGSGPGSRGTRPATFLAIVVGTACRERGRRGRSLPPGVGATVGDSVLWVNPARPRPPLPNQHCVRFPGQTIRGRPLEARSAARLTARLQLSLAGSVGIM